MTDLTTRVRIGRAGLLRTLLLTGAAVLATAGCGSAEGPERELARIEPPSWFTEPTDAAEPDADPPRWTRRYATLPRPSSDVEVVYSQALDRAGWRYHAGECAVVGAPRGGEITADCWTREDLVLAFSATGETSAETGPSRLEIVLHRADRSRPSPSKALSAAAPGHAVGDR
jgi:hypothetical protein